MNFYEMTDLMKESVFEDLPKENKELVRSFLGEKSGDFYDGFDLAIKTCITGLLKTKNHAECADGFMTLLASLYVLRKDAEVKELERLGGKS